MDRKRSESPERRGREREGKRAVSGGEGAQLMMKQGTCGSACALRVVITNLTGRARARGRLGRELKGHGALLLRRRVTANTNDFRFWGNLYT